MSDAELCFDVTGESEGDLTPGELRAMALRIEAQSWHPSQELAASLVRAADLALARANGPAEANGVRKGLLAFERLFELRGARLVEANLLVAQRLRTEWEIGGMLRDTRLHPGGRPRKNLSVNTTGLQTLGEIGLSRDQSSTFQKLATLDQADLEHWIEENLLDGELSTRAALEALWSEQRRQRTTDARVETAEALPGTAGVLLAVADAARLPIRDNAVDLTVTSPPYGLDVAYQAGPDEPDAWVLLLLDWLTELWRVTAPGGRLALNVPLDTTRGGCRPTYSQAVACAEMAGWTYRSTIVWAENNVSKSTARGSVYSQAAPHIMAPVEMIPLFFKPGPDQEWRREPPDGVELDLLPSDWVLWTNGLWVFSGESQGWEGHPAPFPLELPTRLIQLLSFPGDTILDPFLGSGTTALAAWKLGRKMLGFDLSAEYIASAQRRLAQEQAHANR